MTWHSYQVLKTSTNRWKNTGTHPYPQADTDRHLPLCKAIFFKNNPNNWGIIKVYHVNYMWYIRMIRTRTSETTAQIIFKNTPWRSTLMACYSHQVWKQSADSFERYACHIICLTGLYMLKLTWDRRLYFPSKGSYAQDFHLPVKIHRLWSGSNLPTSDPWGEHRIPTPPKTAGFEYVNFGSMRRAPYPRPTKTADSPSFYIPPHLILPS